MEKRVIFIEQPQENDKPIEFTHLLTGGRGWTPIEVKPNVYKKIVYLGKCCVDGDMFAAYSDNTIRIFKGHLNSGRY
jgi:hypothetical protein